MVLDTKWKVFAGPSDVEVADLRQAYAYARIYNACKSYLLYPTWADRPDIPEPTMVADVDQQVRITVLTLPLAEEHAGELDDALLRLQHSRAPFGNVACTWSGAPSVAI